MFHLRHMMANTGIQLSAPLNLCLHVSQSHSHNIITTTIHKNNKNGGTVLILPYHSLTCSLSTNYLSLNPSKCKYMLISRRGCQVFLTDLFCLAIVHCKELMLILVFYWLKTSYDLLMSRQSAQVLGLLYRKFYSHSSTKIHYCMSCSFVLILSTPVQSGPKIFKWICMQNGHL